MPKRVARALHEFQVDFTRLRLAMESGAASEEMRQDAIARVLQLHAELREYLKKIGISDES